MEVAARRDPDSPPLYCTSFLYTIYIYSINICILIYSLRSFAKPHEDKLEHVDALVVGPPETPYEFGFFRFGILNNCIAL